MGSAFLKLLSVLAVLLIVSTPSLSATQGMTPEQERTFQDILMNTRCVTCQNQSIGESNAPVAKAMREFIEEQLILGKTRQAIEQDLSASYGDFVVYKPPLKVATLALWLGPMFFLLLALVLFGMKAKKSS